MLKRDLLVSTVTYYIFICDKASRRAWNAKGKCRDSSNILTNYMHPAGVPSGFLALWKLSCRLENSAGSFFDQLDFSSTLACKHFK